MNWAPGLLLFAAGAALTAVLAIVLARLDKRKQTELLNRILQRNADQRKEAETGRRLAEEKFRSIFENAVEGIIQTSPHGAFLTANPAFARMLGYRSPQELLSKVSNISEQIYVHSHDRDEFKRRVERDGVAKMEYEAWRKNRTIVWLSVSARAVKKPSGEIAYYESIAEDVTDRKRTENALRENRERLQAALNASQTGTFRWRIPEGVLECDESLSGFTGLACSNRALPFTEFADSFHLDDAETTLTTLKESARSLRDLDVEFRLLQGALKNKFIWVSVKGKVFGDVDGHPLYMTGAITDITARKQAEESLRCSEERYRSLIAATSSVIWTANAEGEFTAPQHSWSRYTGQPWEEHRGWGWLKMFAPGDEEQA
ncbi:PAS domain S-box protein, partial [bacterium]|nr:PAS domain S-box protein [bacterium]